MDAAADSAETVTREELLRACAALAWMVREECPAYPLRELVSTWGPGASEAELLVLDRIEGELDALIPHRFATVNAGSSTT